MELSELREELKAFKVGFLANYANVTRFTIYNFINRGRNIRPATIEKLKELVQ